MCMRACLGSMGMPSNGLLSGLQLMRKANDMPCRLLFILSASDNTHHYLADSALRIGFAAKDLVSTHNAIFDVLHAPPCTYLNTSITPHPSNLQSPHTDTLESPHTCTVQIPHTPEHSLQTPQHRAHTSHTYTSMLTHVCRIYQSMSQSLKAPLPRSGNK